jgi:hypothetical protein
MNADDLQLQAGTRLVHIGPHKTGTSAIQGAFHLARPRLAQQGVFYPGRGRQTLWPILAVTGQPALKGEPSPQIRHWDSLVASVQEAGSQRVLVSSEFFAEASDAATRRVIEDLGGPRVHVVATLRSLTRIMPSQWQQYIQNGYRMPYEEWLEGILSEPPRTPTPGFWRRHRHDQLVARWASAAGADHLTVVVVDESDRQMLLRTFESMLGLPTGFLVPEELAENRSLTMAEAEVVRLLNDEFQRKAWPDRNYAKFMRYGAIFNMKTARQPAPGEPRIVTPAWALERAAQISGEMAANIAALGVRVVGDISSLGKIPAELSAQAADAGPATPMIPAEAAVQAIVGAFLAGGVGAETAADILREIDARSMTRVLMSRGRQRVRTKLRLARSMEAEARLASAGQAMAEIPVPRNGETAAASGSAAADYVDGKAVGQDHSAPV